MPRKRSLNQRSERRARRHATPAPVCPASNTSFIVVTETSMPTVVPVNPAPAPASSPQTCAEQISKSILPWTWGDEVALRHTVFGLKLCTTPPLPLFRFYRTGDSELDPNNPINRFSSTTCRRITAAVPLVQRASQLADQWARMSAATSLVADAMNAVYPAHHALSRPQLYGAVAAWEEFKVTGWAQI